MAKSTSHRAARRLIGVVALTGAFALTGSGLALASDVTVGVPGTPITNPCTATVGTSGASNQIPPIVVTEKSTCTV